MRYFALDPGLTSGWAYADTDKGLIQTGKIKLEDLPRALLGAGWEGSDPRNRLRDAHKAVCESFVLRPHQAKQQGGSRMPAPEAIGVLRAAAYIHEKAVLYVSPGAKSAGRAWMSDDMAAFRSTLRSDHERDALDLLAYQIREDYLADRKARR